MNEFRIATWNVNSANVRVNDLLDFIHRNNPDVICLQEIKCENIKFPYKLLSSLPYHFYINGQKNYNGVAILSKLEANEVKTNFPSNSLSDQARFIEINFNNFMGNITVISLYAPNGGGGGLDDKKFQVKLKFYDEFTCYIKNISSFYKKLIIGADYNIAPLDIDVYDPILLENSIGFTNVERKKIQKILNSGFIDNFRIIFPEKREFSWWDYRGNAFKKNKGMRIDSIISSSNVLPFLHNCFIDYETKMRSKRSSDHVPVVAVYRE